MIMYVDAVWCKHWKFLLEDARVWRFAMSFRFMEPSTLNLVCVSVSTQTTRKICFNRVFARTRTYSSYCTTRRDEVSC